MQIVSFVQQYTGLPLEQLAGQWEIVLHLDGSYTVPRWTVTGVPAPTPAQIAAAAAAPEPAPTPAQLVAYATAKQVALRDGGITVNVGSSAAPQEVDVATDDNGTRLVASKIQMIGLAPQLGQPAPTSFNWQNDDGSWVTLSTAQLQTIGYMLPTWHQKTYDALAPVTTAIADGTITSEAGVDAAGWPTPAM